MLAGAQEQKRAESSCDATNALGQRAFQWITCRGSLARISVPGRFFKNCAAAAPIFGVSSFSAPSHELGRHAVGRRFDSWSFVRRPPMRGFDDNSVNFK